MNSEKVLAQVDRLLRAKVSIEKTLKEYGGRLPPAAVHTMQAICDVIYDAAQEVRSEAEE